jgi:hypothetical protein
VPFPHTPTGYTLAQAQHTNPAPTTTILQTRIPTTHSIPYLPRISPATRTHHTHTQNAMSVVYSRRLKKELQEIQIEQADPAKKAAGEFFSPHFASISRAPHLHALICTPIGRTGIQLLQAEDLKTWFFSIEVLGESLYKVRFPTPVFCNAITTPHASHPLCTPTPILPPSFSPAFPIWHL